MAYIVSKMSRLNVMDNASLSKLVGSNNDYGLTNDFALQTILLSTFDFVHSLRWIEHIFFTSIFPEKFLCEMNAQFI
jgi:hypothetical protein